MEYIICRVCGYIEAADKIDQPCPACGFPKTVWMEYKPRKMNERRRKLLDLHLHPIAVHFPIVASALVFGLPILGLLTPFTFSIRLYDFATMVCWVLPLLVLIGAISGVIGGKMRYKTATAPALKGKIYVSIVYFIVSLALFYIGWTDGVHATNALLVGALGGVASLCGAYLGKIGSYLFAGKFGPYVAG